MISLFNLWVTMTPWVWFKVTEIAKNRFYRKRAIVMRAAVETGNSWFVHFRHTKRPISTLTRTLKMITESDIIWTISIMILFRSLNDQENGHDLRCLTAISVKKVASPAMLPPKKFLRSWCYWLTIVSSCLITVIVNIFTWVIAISSNLKFCRIF